MRYASVAGPANIGVLTKAEAPSPSEAGELRQSPPSSPAANELRREPSTLPARGQGPLRLVSLIEGVGKPAEQTRHCQVRLPIAAVNRRIEQRGDANTAGPPSP